MNSKIFFGLFLVICIGANNITCQEVTTEVTEPTEVTETTEVDQTTSAGNEEESNTPVIPLPAGDCVGLEPAEDPKHFYSCGSGNKYLMLCPEGTLFDKELGSCNHESEVNRESQ